MEQPYFMNPDHCHYLQEMAGAKLFTREEIRISFIQTFPSLSTFKVNKIFKYAESVLTF